MSSTRPEMVPSFAWTILLLRLGVLAAVPVRGLALPDELQEWVQCDSGMQSERWTLAAASTPNRALLQSYASRENQSAKANVSWAYLFEEEKPKRRRKGRDGEGDEEEGGGGGEEGSDESIYTMHGCFCMADWQWNGAEVRGCSGNPEEDFAQGHVWCMVDEACETQAGSLPDGQGKWDYCSTAADVTHLRTVHGCHCNPVWEWKERVYSSCGKTSKGPKWCYVFESDQICPQAMRTEHGGQHWDYCFTEDQASPHLTRNGCHCMPEYQIDGVLYQGCSMIKLGEKEFMGCAVLEDGEGMSCKAPFEIEGTTLKADECLFTDDERDDVLSNLVEALSPDCHCQPVWMHQGKEYNDCASTPDRSRGWCYIVEDQRQCPEEDGINGEDGTRWRYCEEDPNAAKPTPAPAPADEGPAPAPAEDTPDDTPEDTPEEPEEKPDKEEGKKKKKNKKKEKKEEPEDNPGVAGTTAMVTDMMMTLTTTFPAGTTAVPESGESEELPEKRDTLKRMPVEPDAGTGATPADTRYVHIVPVVVPYPTNAYQPQAPGGLGEESMNAVRVDGPADEGKPTAKSVEEVLEAKMQDATVEEEKELKKEIAEEKAAEKKVESGVTCLKLHRAVPLAVLALFSMMGWA